MGMFLNSKIPFDAYKATTSGKYFVDKSDLIEELFSALGMDERFFCLTRPRRFGKSVMANMIASFFGNTVDTNDIFKNLKIASSPQYHTHLNQYQVIFIDFSEVPEKCNSYDEYITRILLGIKDDLAEMFPEFIVSTNKSVWDILNEIFIKTNQKFIFVIDEWDAVFHMSFITKKNQEEYLLFLKSLLKGKRYVELAYMTGILPIAKYSSGSELNMFLEYDMTSKVRFSEYFGFLEEEVDKLFSLYQQTTKNSKITRNDLAVWYDGYHTAAGERIYNPRSVVCALMDNQLSNYWTGSGPYDEIFYYIQNNVEEVKDDLVLMIAGEKIEINLERYAATSAKLNTKNQIYSAMVVYGLLTYENGEVFIPNKELMDKFNELLLSNNHLGYVYQLAKESEKMLKATLVNDTKTMVEILKFAHDTESPIFSYNSEIELSAIVNLVYLSARNKYRVEREDKAGEGYVDFIFYPERKGADALILELKIDSTPEKAIQEEFLQ